MSYLDPIYAPWGGNAEAMATDIGEPGVKVRQWRNRGRIPTRYWPKIIEKALECRGVELTLEQFVAVDIAKAA